MDGQHCLQTRAAFATKKIKNKKNKNKNIRNKKIKNKKNLE